MPRKRGEVPKILRLDIQVTQEDIDNGVCQLARLCMEKVAIARTLMARGMAKSDAEARVYVDAGHVRFNAWGWRWKGDTPKVPKASLIRYDRIGASAVRPHSYTLVMHRTTKIVKVSPQRQEQINSARRARIVAGNPDKIYGGHYTLAKRVVGYA